MIGIYVGLWLTPDPSLVTKVLAAAVTVMLLALFTWHDIIGFARAWFSLEEAAGAAATEEELHAAGNAFMREVGRVGFDIFLMIVMWGMGRAARGPLRAARGRIASDATTRAAAGVLEAETRPGSGGTRPAPTAVEAQVVEQARTAAGEGATPDPDSGCAGESVARIGPGRPGRRARSPRPRRHPGDGRCPRPGRLGRAHPRQCRHIPLAGRTGHARRRSGRRAPGAGGRPSAPRARAHDRAGQPGGFPQRTRIDAHRSAQHPHGLGTGVCGGSARASGAPSRPPT